MGALGLLFNVLNGPSPPIDAPPPLPGGYKVGEKVFYTAANYTFPSGDTQVHGQQGEVTGPGNGDARSTGVRVRFPGNKGNVPCTLDEVRRLRCRLRLAHAPLLTPRASPPQPLPRRPTPHCMRSRARRSPLPGCGRDGGRGRGAGWPLRLQRRSGRRPSPTSLLLTAVLVACAQVSRDAPQVSRDAPPLPGGYTVGEKVFYTAANYTFASGNKQVHGQQGEVTGPAASEKAKGKGVNVLFPGNKGSVDCWLTEVRRLRAASAAAAPPAPHKRDAAHVPCVPRLTASAVAPQPSLHEQRLAP